MRHATLYIINCFLHLAQTVRLSCGEIALQAKLTDHEDCYSSLLELRALYICTAYSSNSALVTHSADGSYCTQINDQTSINITV